MTRWPPALRWLLLLPVAALFVTFFGFRLDRYLTLQALHEHDVVLRNLVVRSPVLSAAAFVLLYALTVAISLPGAAMLTIAGGFLFGLWLGTGFAVLGATAGAVMAFSFARFIIGDGLRVRAGPFLARMAQGFERNAFTYLLFLRLIPAFPFWAVNLGAALFGVRLRSFLIATLIGIVPGALAYASIGDALGQYFEADPSVALGHMVSWPIIVLRCALAPLALVPFIGRWWRHRAPHRS